MKIGIVGACGYLGSALIRKLASEFTSAQLVLIDDFSTSSSQVLADLPAQSKAILIEGTILDPEIRGALQAVDVVINLLPSVEVSGKIPTLEALAAFLAPRGCPLLHVSSTAVYGASARIDTELSIEALKPQTKEGLAASLAERRLREFGTEEKLHYATLRLAPLLGRAPGMHLRSEPQSWIWAVVRGAQPEISPGILDHSRPYLAIPDACSAALKIIQQERFDRDAWNIFSGHLKGEQFLGVLREKVPALGYRLRNDSRPEYYAGPCELASKKTERSGITPSTPVLSAYREVLEAFGPLLPQVDLPLLPLPT